MLLKRCTKVASGVHLEAKSAFDHSERAKVILPFNYLIKFPRLEIVQGRVQEHLNFKPSSTIVYFFGWGGILALLVLRLLIFHNIFILSHTCTKSIDKYSLSI